MKKLIFALIFAFFGFIAYGQISPDSAYTTADDDLLEIVGAGGHSLGGDSKKEAYLKINARMDTLSTFFVVDTVTAGLDSTELNDILGITPAQATGKRWYLKQAAGTHFWMIMSDGTEWFKDSLIVITD